MTVKSFFDASKILASARLRTEDATAAQMLLNANLYLARQMELRLRLAEYRRRFRCDQIEFVVDGESQ